MISKKMNNEDNKKLQHDTGSKRHNYTKFITGFDWTKNKFVIRLEDAKTKEFWTVYMSSEDMIETGQEMIRNAQEYNKNPEEFVKKMMT